MKKTFLYRKKKNKQSSIETIIDNIINGVWKEGMTSVIGYHVIFKKQREV